MDRGVSDSWGRMSRIDSGGRSTNALLVIISLTYRPAPNSRQSRRNAVFVIPAIGASTTGISSGRGPMCRGAGGRGEAGGTRLGSGGEGDKGAGEGVGGGRRVGARRQCRGARARARARVQSARYACSGASCAPPNRRVREV